MTSCIFDFP